MNQDRKVTVVLGGGGMKGLAHVGALKALHRHGIVPDEYVGTSVGSYIAALAAGGLSPAEMEATALSIRPKDILDYDWATLLFRRWRARSLYRGKALHDFVRRTLPVDRFDQLPKPLYLSSVDLGSGQEVIWGLPGYREIPIHDCVVASCAIPGIYPPKKINQFYFVDGGLVDTLPVKVAVYNKADLIIAIYLEPPEVSSRRVDRRGMGAILEQSQSILSRALLRHNLHYFEKAPIVLVQPRVGEHGLFEFRNAPAVIAAGEEATEAALRESPLTRGLLRPAAPPQGGGPPPPPLPPAPQPI
jgi:NTE family protein